MGDLSARAARNIEWIESKIRVPEGIDTGKPLRLRQFQRDIIEKIYDGQTRRVIVSVGGKNAKTALSAILLLLHLCGPEAKRNSKLNSTAQSKEQAAIIFGYACKMILMNPELEEFISIIQSKKELKCPELGTEFAALSAEVVTAHGISPIFAVHDELGQVEGPRSELYEVVERKMGAHQNPLSVIISTQAKDDSALLSILIDDAIKNPRPRTKLFLWTAPKDCDILDREAWRAANPAMGDFLNEEEIEEQANDAKRMPSFEAGFRNLTLNQRVKSESLFVSLSLWDASKSPQENFWDGRDEVHFGLDLSGRTDLTALVWSARDGDKIMLWPEFFAPSEGVAERSKVDRVPYDLWAKQGWIILTPGATIDYRWVAAHLLARSKQMKIVGGRFDPWRFSQLEDALLEESGVADSIPMTKMPQTQREFHPAIEEFEARMANRLIVHNGNPCMRFCVANSVVTYDMNKNKFINKKKSRGRIDGMVAALMSIRSMIGGDQTEKKSVYETRGLRRLTLVEKP